MSARRLADFSRARPTPRCAALWLAALTGCLHRAPPPHNGSCPPAPPPVVPTPLAAPRADSLPSPAREVAWQLRISEAAPWSPVPETLHTFSLPRWECALGATQSDGATPNSQVLSERTRRLACTHKSGITVQTRLDCPVQDTAQSARREIELSLDTLPALRVACEAEAR